jgi:D-threo-aldose 1-dehydrogenase
VSCISGVRSLAQLDQNLAWFEAPIPAELWHTLRERGLLHADAPLPEGN